MEHKLWKRTVKSILFPAREFFSSYNMHINTKERACKLCAMRSSTVIPRLQATTTLISYRVQEIKKCERGVQNMA
jgi:hypothetical protein